MRCSLRANSGHSHTKYTDLQRDLIQMNRLVENGNMSTLQTLDMFHFQTKGTKYVNTSRKELAHPDGARKGGGGDNGQYEKL
jgi:hypothetical protein